MKMTLALNNPLQNSNTSLGASMRIRDFEKQEVNNAVQDISLEAGQETDKTKNAPVTANISDTGKFAYEFYRKCIE